MQNITPSLVFLYWPCQSDSAHSPGVSFPLAGGRRTVGSLVGNDLIVTSIGTNLRDGSGARILLARNQDAVFTKATTDTRAILKPPFG